MKPFLFIILLLLISTGIKAETLSTDSLNNKRKILGVSLSYFAESGYRHGGLAGMEYLAFSRVKINTKKINRKRIHQLLLSPSIGFYYHPNNKTALIIKGDFAHRLTYNSGLFGVVGFGTGLMRSFYNIPTYQIKDDVLIELKRAGRTTSISNLLFGIGYDFNAKLDVPLSMTIQPEIYIQVPYNHKYVVFPAWQLKFVYSINLKQ